MNTDLSSCQDINPWTVRDKKSHVSQHSTKANKRLNDHHSLPLRQLNNNTAINRTKDASTQLPLIGKKLQAVNLKIQDVIANEKIKQLQAILNQGNCRFLPNYKLVNISFGLNPRNSRKHSKSLPYHLSSLRQYTELLQIDPKKGIKHSSPKQQRRKSKKYFTQIRSPSEQNMIFFDSLRNEQNKGAQDQHALIKNSANNRKIEVNNQNKAQEKEKNLNSQNHLGVDTNKRSNLNESLRGTLSLMKRCYNLKKIKRILL